MQYWSAPDRCEAANATYQSGPLYVPDQEQPGEARDEEYEREEHYEQDYDSNARTDHPPPPLTTILGLIFS